MRLVVKVGGRVIEEGLRRIALDLVEVASKNKVFIVHGGGKQVTDVAERMGKEQKFIVSPSGFRSRYTDSETIEIYEMVVGGLLNKKIVLELQKNGLKAIGLTGIDGYLLKASRKKKLKSMVGGKVLMVDGGYTGRVTNANGELLLKIVDNGYIPVVAALAVGEENEPLNVDGDRAAAEVAGAVSADTLIIFTDVKGVLNDQGKLIERMEIKEIPVLMQKVGFGMRKKLLASREAIEKGVRRVIVASGLREKPVQRALKLEECTVIEHVNW